METLQVPVKTICHRTSEIRLLKTSSFVGHRGFVRTKRYGRKIQSFYPKTSLDKRGGGFVCRSSGSAQDNKQEEGLFLGNERDSSGSVVGFQLIPNSATTEENLLQALDTVANGERELSGEAKTQSKTPTIVNQIIVFVTSEASPYSKTGGLGDVCGSLPVALALRGHRIMVVSPRYVNGSSSDKNAVDTEKKSKIYCFGGMHVVGFFHEFRAGVDWVFIDHPSYKRPGTAYGDTYGAFGVNQVTF